MGCGHSLPTVPITDERPALLKVSPKDDANFDSTPTARSLSPTASKEDVFAKTFDSSPVGLIICKPDNGGTIWRLNASACRMFGYSSEELVGRSIDMLCPIHIRHIHAAMRKGWDACPVARSMGGKAAELNGCRKDGTEFPLEIGLTPVQIGGHHFSLATIVDHSYRFKAAQAEKAAAEALAASKARGDTLSTMSHEIRNPLNGVIGSAALLLDVCTTDEQRELVSTIVACGEATLAVVNDILDWSKIDAGRMDVEHIAFSPGEVVREVMDIMRAPAEDKGVHLTAIQIEGSYGKPGLMDKRGRAQVLPGVQVFGDPTRVRQILLNFVSNAVKFVKEDGSGAVTLRAGLLPIPDKAEGNGGGTARTAGVATAMADPSTARDVISTMSRTDCDDPRAPALDPATVVHASNETSPAPTPTPLVGPMAARPLIPVSSPVPAPSPIVVRGPTSPVPPTVTASGSYKKIKRDSMMGTMTTVEHAGEGMGDYTHELVLEVEDNGAGMSVETQHNLFKPFTQASTSTARKHGGTGLGLSICKALVGLMGGTIVLTSAPGKGSTFGVRLPVWLVDRMVPGSSTISGSSMALKGRVASTSPQNSEGHVRLDGTIKTSGSTGPAESARGPSRSGSVMGMGMITVQSMMPFGSPLTGARILVVDDNAVNRRLASAMLSKLGCIVESACDGDEAVAAWKASMAGGQPSPAASGPGGAGPEPAAVPYDVILMDILMPHMDGHEATREIRRLEALQPTLRRTPILALSGGVMPDDIAKCTAAGMDACVSKPVRLRELQTALQKAIAASVPTGADAAQMALSAIPEAP